MSTDKKNTSLLIFLSSLKMALATLTSRILGLGRELTIAALFGASGLTDAFFVAYRIPNILRDLFAEGAFSSAFVPIMTKAKQESEEKSRSLLWSLFILLGCITGFITLLTFLFAPQLIDLFAPSFSAIPEKYKIATNLTRIMSPFFLFISLAALFMGTLNTLRIFFIPALAPASFNLMMIISCVIFPPILSKNGISPIYALGLGVFLGGIAQAAVQFPLLLKRGYGPILPKKIITPESKKVFLLLGPGIVGLAATQMNLLVTTILATTAAVGAVSWLNYAFRIFQLPIGVLSVSIANSNLVHFSDAWKAGRFEEANECVKSSIFLNLLALMPAMAILSAVAPECVEILLERGKFTHESTLMTSIALKYYLLGLPFYGLYKITVPCFYTLNKPLFPVICSISTVIFNVIFCLILTPIYGFKILAIGTTLSICINSIIQIYILKRKIGLPWQIIFNLKILKIIISSLLTFAATYLLIKNIFDANSIFIIKFFQFVLCTMAGFILYLASLFILGEGKNVKKLLKKDK